MHEKLRSIARWAVVLAVAISPWLFGSAEPWAYLPICFLVGVGFAAWLLSLLCDGPVLLRAPLLALVLVALFLYGVIQAVPLPRPLVERASPLAAEAQGRRSEVLAEIGGAELVPSAASEDTRHATLSVSAIATQRSLYLLAAYIAAFLVLANTFCEWQQVRRAAVLLVASAFAMTVFALIQNFSRADAIYWFHKPRFGGAIFGPFTNRNHFAAHVNMAFGIALGLLLTATRAPEEQSLATWRKRLAWLISNRGSQIALLGFAALLMAAAVCVTLSRGGIISLAISAALVGGAVLVCQGSLRRKMLVVAGACVVTALVVLAVRWLSWHPLLERLATLADVARDPLSDSRTIATRDTLRVFGASPFFGCGFGTFRHVFPAFQSQGIQGGRWLHAHNDYAQLLAEGGVVGVLLVLGGVWLLARSIVSRFSRTTADSRWFVVGVALGLSTIAVHSFFDYSLHRPANALLLAALCGMSLAVVHLPTVPRARPWGVAVRALAVASLCALIIFALAGSSGVWGELAFARFLHLRQLARQPLEPTAAAKVVSDASVEADEVLDLGRRSPDALCDVSAACLRWSASDAVDPVLRLQLGEKATAAAILAVQAVPSDYRAWHRLARAVAAMGLDTEAELCRARAQVLAPPGTTLPLLAAEPEGRAARGGQAEPATQRSPALLDVAATEGGQ